MINSLKKWLKKETGQVLPMALILLVLGGLLIIPILNLMTTNLTANRVVEEENSGIYAADAGIQDSMWKLGNGVQPFPEDTISYVLPEDVNGMTVTVEKEAVEQVGGGTLYTIRSTANLNGDNVTSIVVQAMAGENFHWLFENAITSAGDIDLSPGDIIYGDVMCSGDFNGDGDQVNGDITQDVELIMPTEETLSAFYENSFDGEVCADPDNYCPDNPYPNSTYSVSGGTYSEPQELPWLYCAGNLEIVGDGYTQLGGNIYVNGKFELSDMDVILDLNGYTIYATYYNNCSGDAIYFGSDSQLRGPGCAIGVGNVNFQPSLGQGKKLFENDKLVVEEEYKGFTGLDRFVFSKFKTIKKISFDGTDKLSTIQVLCHIDDPEAPPAHLKVALYTNNICCNEPGYLLTSTDGTDNITVSSWAPISLPEPYQLLPQTYYWLAAIADADIIVTDSSETWDSKYKDNYFDNPFPQPADEYGEPNTTSVRHMLRGFTSGQDFIFLMSIKCSTNLQPSANFYGSIAGSTNVNLQPGCFINLVGLPEEGLEFPSIVGQTSVGNTGDAPPIINYDIQ